METFQFKTILATFTNAKCPLKQFEQDAIKKQPELYIIKVVLELSNENLLNLLNLVLIDSFLKLVGGNKGHVYFKEKILAL